MDSQTRKEIKEARVKVRKSVLLYNDIAIARLCSFALVIMIGGLILYSIVSTYINQFVIGYLNWPTHISNIYSSTNGSLIGNSSFPILTPHNFYIKAFPLGIVLLGFLGIVMTAWIIVHVGMTIIYAGDKGQKAVLHFVRKAYPCQLCQVKPFSSKDKLKYHMYRKHMEGIIVDKDALNEIGINSLDNAEQQNEL